MAAKKGNFRREKEEQAQALEAAGLVDDEKAKEDAERMAEGRTRGRQGLALLRVSVGFTPDVYDYAQTMARLHGKTITSYITDMLKADREKNMEIYQRAKDLLQEIQE